MKKYILILLSLSLLSCAARKVNVDKTEVKSKVDSTSVTKQEEVTTKDNHISVVTNTDELEITPIDTSKCIEIDGKKYHNAKLRYKNTKKVLVDTTKIKVSKKASNEVVLKKDSSVEIFKKNIDKKADYTIIWWWLLIVLLAASCYYAYKKINKTLL
jgi:hypothetical protein